MRKLTPRVATAHSAMTSFLMMLISDKKPARVPHRLMFESSRLYRVKSALVYEVESLAASGQPIGSV